MSGLSREIQDGYNAEMLAYLRMLVGKTDRTEFRTIEFLLTHGEFFDPVHHLVEYAGVPNRCFANALDLAKVSNGELIYCEGYSHAEDDAWARHHAWCVNPHGEVVERTWSRLGSTYFGVPFDPSIIETWGQEDDDMGLLRPQNLNRLPPDFRHNGNLGKR